MRAILEDWISHCKSMVITRIMNYFKKIYLSERQNFWEIKRERDRERWSKIFRPLVPSPNGHTRPNPGARSFFLGGGSPVWMQGSKDLTIFFLLFTGELARSGSQIAVGNLTSTHMRFCHHVSSFTCSVSMPVLNNILTLPLQTALTWTDF